MEHISIGTITKPQALKGEFRVKPSLLNLKSYKKIEKVTIDQLDYVVEKVTLRDTFVIFKLKGIEDCDTAEKFRNKQISADMEVEVEDSFDLNNFDVIIDSVKIGRIVDVNNYGSKDIITVVGDRNFMLPIIDGLIVSTDNATKSIIIDKNIFEQVVVYEN